MRYEDFTKKSPGTLIPTLFGQRAFVPNPLPPKYDLARIAPNLAKASAAMGELKGAIRKIIDPYIMILPLQRREALTSSALEGTYSTSNELAFAEAGFESQSRSEAREVANYVRALMDAVIELNTLPISGRLIKNAHRTLLSGVGSGRGQDKLPGEFKRDQNMIGGRRMEDARFIPPPPGEAIKAMSDLESYINRDKKDAALALIDLALVHYQFETIHPFADGNGRVGRMLISLMALSENLLDQPLLYMSPELEANKDEYIDNLYTVSTKGLWEHWIGFFLDMLARSARRAITTIDQLVLLHEEYSRRVKETSRSTNMLSITDLLFRSPVLGAKRIVDELGVTDAAARKLLRQLSEIGILEELREYYPTVWVARDVIALSDP